MRVNHGVLFAIRLTKVTDQEGIGVVVFEYNAIAGILVDIVDKCSRLKYNNLKVKTRYSVGKLYSKAQ